jgi:metal-responsive CopG/Arc/MetJ family transcriptional regulator
MTEADGGDKLTRFEVTVEFAPEMAAEIDSWIETQGDKPSRSEAIKRLTAIALRDRRQKPR